MADIEVVHDRQEDGHVVTITASRPLEQPELDTFGEYISAGWKAIEARANSVSHLVAVKPRFRTDPVMRAYPGSDGDEMKQVGTEKVQTNRPLYCPDCNDELIARDHTRGVVYLACPSSALKAGDTPKATDVLACGMKR